MRQYYSKHDNIFHVYSTRIVKIWAYGSWKRFMWIEIGDDIKCFMIDNNTYEFLKECGVATAQSLRKK